MLLYNNKHRVERLQSGNQFYTNYFNKENQFQTAKINSGGYNVGYANDNKYQNKNSFGGIYKPIVGKQNKGPGSAPEAMAAEYMKSPVGVNNPKISWLNGLSGDTKSAGMGLINSGVQAGAGLLDKSVSDNKDYTFTAEEKGARIVGGLGKVVASAATGLMTGGPVMAAITGGLALGTEIAGFVKEDKDATRNKGVRNKRLGAEGSSIGKQDLINKEKSLYAGNQAYSYNQGTNKASKYYGSTNRGFSIGGKFYNSDVVTIKAIADSKKVRTPIFKQGGMLLDSVNIIPNGVLHEENNDLGDKGMPVVRCNAEKSVCDKKYEIEKEELITTFGVTKKIEELAKGGKTKELGLFLSRQLIDNTHSFSEKYKDLNKLN